MNNEKKYTDKQLEVIDTSKSGYNMVLAGPGCGKTDILAERLARAYENGEAELADMLCLTFTNRAARGMYNRIKQRLDIDSSDLFVGNIHRYCSHFLFDNKLVPVDTSIMDENDTIEVLSSDIIDENIKILTNYEDSVKFVRFDWSIVNDLLDIDIHPSGTTDYVKTSTADKVFASIRIKIMDMHHLVYQIRCGHPEEDYYRKQFLDLRGVRYYYPSLSDFKEACIRIKFNKATFKNLNPVDKLIALADLYGTYKEEHGLLDFDDLLLKTYDAYYNDSDHRLKRYKWIQIDEIQDLSDFQMSLVDLLTDKRKDFVVLYLGDEQQAIYSFMGASLSTLDKLRVKCQNRIYHLDKNFRSPKYLLDLYNEYAYKELHCAKDILPAAKDQKESNFLDICIHEYENLDEEAEHVYNAILPFLGNEQHKDDRTALLVPWNRDADEISDRLMQKKVPHFKISGMDAFQMVHMKTLMAHFNAVNNDFDFMAWSRILKETQAVSSYSQGRKIVSDMRNIGLCPSDLLRDNGSTLCEFQYYFDNEEIVLFDTETTGVDVFTDDIIQIAAIKIRNGILVQDSFKEIYIKTDKTKIPRKLGLLENPMVKDYAKAEHEGRVVSRTEGLRDFMRYVGDAILLGHNVNYDYNILKFNLKRYCGHEYKNYEAPILDTLKLAHLIYPRLRKYKLGYLIERLGLKGQNSHNAKDDIMATFELAKYFRTKVDELIEKQIEFYQKDDVKEIIYELYNGYKEYYDLTKSRLYELKSNTDEFVIVKEMRELSNFLSQLCEFRKVERFDMILSFMNDDVLSRNVPNALKAQFDMYLMDMTTYREADLCASSNFPEKLFVSTVHKAKGLEFENVIVMRAVQGRYPHFAHADVERQEEDKRLFYVAISRAMKRLVVSGAHKGTHNEIEASFLFEWNNNKKITPFLYPIVHRFTLRTLYNEYLLEIGTHELRIFQNKSLKRKYKNIDKLYPIYYSNQFTLADKIKALGSPIELIEKVDKLMQTHGINPIY